MHLRLAHLALFCLFAAPLPAQELAISYPGLTGESARLWVSQGAGHFKEQGLDVKLVYMEGGRLSIQSLLSGHTQFMAGDAVSALTAVAGGADIVLLASAKNLLPYVFAVAKDVRRFQDLKGRVVGVSQIGGRAGEIARMVFRNNGLDPDKDVTYLAVGGTLSRLAALAAGRVHAAPISKGVAPQAEEKGLRVLEVEAVPLIIDALWTTRKYAEENPAIIQRAARAYVSGIATILRDRQKTLGVLRKFMKSADARGLDSALDVYVNGLDRVPIPSDKAIQNTLELSYRVAPKLNGLDIKRHWHFAPIQRLKDEGFIDKLYK